MKSWYSRHGDRRGRASSWSPWQDGNGLLRHHLAVHLLCSVRDAEIRLSVCVAAEPQGFRCVEVTPALGGRLPTHKNGGVRVRIRAIGGIGPVGRNCAVGGVGRVAAVRPVRREGTVGALVVGVETVDSVRALDRRVDRGRGRGIPDGRGAVRAFAGDEQEKDGREPSDELGHDNLPEARFALCEPGQKSELGLIID